MSPIKQEKVKILVALGNPGEEYRETFHNAGALFAEFLAEGAQFKKESSFEYAKLDNGLVIVRPDCFMNESGIPTKEALKKFKAKPEEMMVAHDESDLEIGDYKLSFDRGAAGHRGILSILEHVKTSSFWRARIGIRSGKGKAGEFVLKRISASEMKKLHLVFGDLKEKVIEKVNP